MPNASGKDAETPGDAAHPQHEKRGRAFRRARPALGTEERNLRRACLGRPLSRAELASALSWDESTAQAAIDDLVGWRMARQTRDGIAATGGKPWDLLFAAFEERRRREIEPAVQVLARAARAAERDGTSPGAVTRIRDLHDLARDLSHLAERVGRVSSATLTRLVGLGGRFARIIGSRS